MKNLAILLVALLTTKSFAVRLEHADRDTLDSIAEAEK